MMRCDDPMETRAFYEDAALGSSSNQELIEQGDEVMEDVYTTAKNQS